MSPTQFGTHCVPNWKLLIKVPHVAQVTFIKPFPKPRRQHLRQRRQQSCPVDRSFGSSLFKFDDVPADLAAGLHLKRIDRAQDFLASLADQLAKFVDQGSELRIIQGRCRCHWSVQPLRGGGREGCSKRSWVDAGRS